MILLIELRDKWGMWRLDLRLSARIPRTVAEARAVSDLIWLSEAYNPDDANTLFRSRSLYGQTSEKCSVHSGFCEAFVSVTPRWIYNGAAFAIPIIGFDEPTFQDRWRSGTGRKITVRTWQAADTCLNHRIPHFTELHSNQPRNCYDYQHDFLEP